MVDLSRHLVLAVKDSFGTPLIGCTLSFALFSMASARRLLGAH